MVCHAIYDTPENAMVITNKIKARLLNFAGGGRDSTGTSPLFREAMKGEEGGDKKSHAKITNNIASTSAKDASAGGTAVTRTVNAMHEIASKIDSLSS
jgi:hypothetical protein